MRRWRTKSNVQLLAAMILVVGGLLGVILWMTQSAKASSSRASGGATSVVVAQRAPVAVPAILPATVPAALPRACAAALRPIATKDAAAKVTVNPRDDVRLLAGLDLAIPVAGVEKASLYDSFSDGRGARKHEAIDIHAPRGTPVIAAVDGCVVKLFRSVPGGITLYQYDPEGNFAFYYAHMDRYADDVEEGTLLRRGDVIGYVGTTGNAPPKVPHLHFAIFRLGPEKRWWVGTAVNPYAVFTYQ